MGDGMGGYSIYSYLYVIGVHAIFGAFMVGLIIPRKYDYVKLLIEKLEDLVQMLSFSPTLG